MSEKWLSSRLTKSRKKSPVWVALNEVIEEFWEQVVFPDIERLRVARKLYSNDEELLNNLIEEMGDFFEAPEIDEFTRNIQRHIDLLWRRSELHNKNLQLAFDSYVNRVMVLHNLNFKWLPLYWRRDEEYETATFYPALPELSHYADNLSSRGSIYADLGSLENKPAEWIEDKINLAINRAKKILPINLVIEGGLLARDTRSNRFVFFKPRIKAYMVAHGVSEKGRKYTLEINGKTSLITDLGVRGGKSSLSAYGANSKNRKYTQVIEGGTDSHTHIVKPRARGISFANGSGNTNKS